MSMSKKDFIALADAIRDWNANPPTTFNGTPCEQFTELQIAHLATFCDEQNPNFMRNRWISYIRGECGKNGGKVAA